MQLIQIFIPIFDNEGHPFDRSRFGGIRQQLMERFGGLTALVQLPALGVWKQAVAIAAFQQ